MNPLLNISIVVPVFNSSICLEELVVRTSKVMSEMNKSFEIILVDDGSKDHSWEVIKTLKAKHPNLIKGIRLAKNYGQQNATLCGFEHAQGEFVVSIDDDLEYPPETIPDLFKKQAEGGYDLVYGAYRKKKQSFLRKTLTWCYKIMSRILNKQGDFTASSFRLLKAPVAKAILCHQQAFSIIDEFITWHTDSIVSISIDCENSKKGKSGYRLVDLINIFRGLLLISSRKQLQLVTSIGYLMVSVNFVIGIIIIYRKLVLSIHVAGYTSIIVAVLFSSGVIVLGLAIIAENISRIIKVNFGQPGYVEIEKINL